jgi:hypothetical protein
MFTHCSPAHGATVSFALDLRLANPGPNYLSAGEMPLPLMLGLFSAIFACGVGLWLRQLFRNQSETHTIHHLLTFLFVLKSLSLFSESLMLHFVAITGHSTGWNVLFYIINTAKGLALIAVLALIGTGWSLLRPFLMAREKKVIAIALAIQVLANIALIVVEEKAPGSIAFLAWVDVLHVTDIVSSAAVLIPVAWSIKHLKDATMHSAEREGEDSKTRSSLARLMQFRTFYLTTLAYLYFTRIIVYLLASTLPFHHQWLARFFEEIASVAYYLVTAYRFRPTAENSQYLRVSSSEDDGDSAGGQAIEMTRQGGVSSATASIGHGAAAPVQTVARSMLTSHQAVEGGATAAGATSQLLNPVPMRLGNAGASGDDGAGFTAAAIAAAEQERRQKQKAAKGPSRVPVQIAIEDDDDDDDDFDLGHGAGQSFTMPYSTSRSHLAAASLPSNTVLDVDGIDLDDLDDDLDLGAGTKTVGGLKKVAK